eukprot:jgi/Botrbrau1/5848/Bobra.0366s0029.1
MKGPTNGGANLCFFRFLTAIKSPGCKFRSSSSISRPRLVGFSFRAYSLFWRSWARKMLVWAAAISSSCLSRGQLPSPPAMLGVVLGKVLLSIGRVAALPYNNRKGLCLVEPWGLVRYPRRMSGSLRSHAPGLSRAACPSFSFNVP